MKKSLHILLILCSLSLCAQNLDKANSLYKDYNYVDATKLYLKLVESGYASSELYKKLGNIYYFQADYVQAEKWYGKLDAEKAIEDPEYQLRYAQALMSVGKTEEAKTLYNRYLNTEGALNEMLSSSLDYSEIIDENDERYTIFPLKVNSVSTDYGSFVYDGKLYFSSSRNNGRGKNVDTWNGQPFLDIYTVDIDTNGETDGEPQEIKGKVNTKLHESSAIITKDGNTMYFTASNTTPNGKAKKSDQQKLKIYRATLNNGKWEAIEDLSINSDTFSNAHPALSLDEKTLYFVSDRPESYGATDIFKVQISENGTLGNPVNMGVLVNTRGRESFPFITEENELYFSSDGHLGLGGYDIFYLDLQANKQQLLNVGKPLNGPFDDYAFSINNTTKRGLFSSNRMGIDNIYSVLETEPIEDLLPLTIEGVITDESGKPLEGVEVELIGMDGTTVLTVTTDTTGKYTVEVDKNKRYQVKLEKQDYDTTGKIIKGMDLQNVSFEMVKTEVDLRKLLHFENVYFDYNSSYIRQEAKEELDKIAEILNTHTDINILVNSYADSRGSKTYNKWLSERRTNRIIEYLVAKKIDRQRLKGGSYGEDNLLNDCADGADCPEQLHQQNRRTEFIVQ